MKKCKWCASEIPKEAIICPVCKRRVKGLTLLQTYLILIIIVSIIAGICSIYAMYDLNNSLEKNNIQQIKKN